MENWENKLIAEIAQLVEQRFRKAWVVGSSPTFGSDFKTLQASHLRGFFGSTPKSVDFNERRRIGQGPSIDNLGQHQRLWNRLIF